MTDPQVELRGQIIQKEIELFVETWGKDRNKHRLKLELEGLLEIQRDHYLAKLPSPSKYRNPTSYKKALVKIIKEDG